MKTLIRILIAIVIFILPVGARFAWFYQGVYQRTSPVPMPDYAALTSPKAPISAVSPVSTTAEEPAALPRGPVVLIDAYHGNSFKGSEIEPLTLALTDLGARIEPYDGSLSLSEQLKYSSALLLIAPTTIYSTYEIQAIARFVRQGGNLLVISDPTRSSVYDSWSGLTYSSVEYANQVLAPFRMAFHDDYVYNLIKNEGNFRNLILTDLPSQALTEGVDELVLYGAQSLKASGTPVLVGDANTLSSIDDQGGSLTLAATGQDDHVLAIGDLSFLSPTYNKMASNQQFTRNIAHFLTSGKNAPGLENFPVLFERPVALLFDEETSLDASMIQMVATVQASLQTVFDLPVSLASKPPEGHDLVVTGTFDSLDADLLVPFIKDYKLQYEEKIEEEEGEETVEEEPVLEPTPSDTVEETEETPTPESELGWWDTGEFGDYEEEPEPVGYITIPEVGKFKTAGVGILLFQAGEDHNQLVLLAESDQELATLAGLLSGGSLSSCLKVDQIAVCSISLGY